MTTANVIAQSLLLEQPRIVKLLEFQFSTGTLRYCNLDKNSSGGNTYTFGGNVYTCRAFSIESEGSQASDLRMDDTIIRMSNVDNLFGININSNNLVNTIVILIKTFEGLTDAADYIEYWKLRIDTPEYNHKDMIAIFTLKSLFDELLSKFPLHVRDRNRCGWLHFDADGTNAQASANCGWFTKYANNYYPGNLAGALNPDYPAASITTCDKGHRTPNGCHAHFNPAGLGKPKLRARMYPGLPTVPIRGLD